MFWRTHHGDEVDVVLENRRGQIVAIEIKAGASIGGADLRAMSKLRDAAGDRFVAGLVRCTTRQRRVSPAVTAPTRVATGGARA